MSVAPPTPFKSAIAWSVVDIIWRRRRASHPMLPLIARPMDGHYFCVSLMRSADMQPVLMMNLAGGSLWTEPFRTGAATPQPESLERGYVTAFAELGIRQMVTDVEVALGLPASAGKAPATTRETVAVRVLAGIMQRLAFADEALIAESGFQHDVGVMPFLIEHPTFGPRLEKIPPDDWQAKARLGAELWHLRSGEGLIEVNASTGRVRVLASAEELDMFAEYERNGRRLAPIVDWVLDRV